MTGKGEIKITKKVKDMFRLPSDGTDFNQLVECNKNDHVIVALK